MIYSIVGLQYNTITKTLGDSIDREGLNFGPIGFKYIIFPSIYKTMEFHDITVSSVYILKKFLQSLEV